MEFIINDKGQAIIRKCENCVHWRKISASREDKTGYCRNIPLAFAYTGKMNVYGITNSFYTCEQQKIINEDELKQKNGIQHFGSVADAVASQKKQDDH